MLEVSIPLVNSVAIGKGLHLSQLIVHIKVAEGRMPEGRIVLVVLIVVEA